MLVTLLLQCLFLSVVQCTPYWKAAYRPRRVGIIGGNPAESGEYPYILSLQDTSFGFRYHFCGASLYNENWGITAAQCFQGEDADDPSYIVAVAGDLRIEQTDGHEQTIQLEKFLQHEDYNGYKQSNDIALLKLSKPFVFNDFVKPIPLAPSGHNATGSCNIAGWGATKEGGRTSDLLMKAQIPIASDDTCRNSYGDSFEDGMICAGYPEGGIGTCTADTGGPLVCSDTSSRYLAGIVSWSTGCARPYNPDVYTEVAYYLDWIKSHVS